MPLLWSGPYLCRVPSDLVVPSSSIDLTKLHIKARPHLSFLLSFDFHEAGNYDKANPDMKVSISTHGKDGSAGDHVGEAFSVQSP